MVIQFRQKISRIGKVIQRVDFKPAANQKQAGRYRTKFLVFLKQQTRDQKSTQHKKQIDANPTHRLQGRREQLVSKQDQNDGDAPKKIEFLNTCCGVYYLHLVHIAELFLSRSVPKIGLH